MLTSSCLVWNEESEINSETENDQTDLELIHTDSDESSSDQVGFTKRHKRRITFIGPRKDEQGALNFMTLFFLKLMEIMITRAKNRHDIIRSFICTKQPDANTPQSIPHILYVFSHINDFLQVVISIGKIALEDLVSGETCLVFPKDKLERDIGQKNVEFAMKAGILSQAKAPGLSYQQRVSVSFYHKSIQEFIAALYIVLWGYRGPRFISGTLQYYG